MTDPLSTDRLREIAEALEYMISSPLPSFAPIEYTARRGRDIEHLSIAREFLALRVSKLEVEKLIEPLRTAHVTIKRYQRAGLGGDVYFDDLSRTEKIVSDALASLEGNRDER